MIYDVFPFFNESEIVRIRFEELYPIVDKFVVVECNKTFTNKPKPWKFDISSYQKYADKILYIQTDDVMESSNPWDHEGYQRDLVLNHWKPEDDSAVIYGDCDEIPKRGSIQWLLNRGMVPSMLAMSNHRFAINWKCNEMIWNRCVIVRGKQFIHQRPCGVRTSIYTTRPGCGWHLGTMGGIKTIVEKLESFSHANEESTKHIKSQLINGVNPQTLEWEQIHKGNQSEDWPIMVRDNWNHYVEQGLIQPY